MNNLFEFWAGVLSFSVFKLLFVNSYRSTDFEVHRNWLAITYSLPLTKWYHDSTSEWTLDYPPFFAYFEWILSQIGVWFDPEMVVLTNLNYASKNTILFQRLTVITSDIILALGILQCANAVNGQNRRIHIIQNLFLLIFMNAGLFIVDQIHFQYNGFLFGILLLSIGFITQERFYLGAFFFTCLLNFKHIYLYMAPAFGVYLLSMCWLKTKNAQFGIDFKKILNLGGIVIGVTAISLGPFYSQLPQLLSRLFPFKRGLSHTYWAPNFWAIYNTADVGLNLLLGSGKIGRTRGILVEDMQLLLPEVKPVHTFIITLLFMLPILYKIWRYPNAQIFLRGVILTSWTSFMFGYHVHEKAILNVIIPFALLVIQEPDLFLLTMISGTISLFPLLFTPFENVIKIFLFLGHLTLVASFVICSYKFKWYETIYLLGFIPLNFVELLVYNLFPHYQFIPLICFSDYCFIGLFYSYIEFYRRSILKNKFT